MITTTATRTRRRIHTLYLRGKPADAWISALSSPHRVAFSESRLRGPSKR